MTGSTVELTVFTKPWKMPLPELGRFVRQLGFDGIELPVRPGYQVEPERVAEDLPKAARLLGDAGVKIGSVAGPADEPTISACADAGVPVIRIMVPIARDRGYLEQEAAALRQFAALAPILDRYGVTVGVQNHCDRFVNHAMGLRRLVERFDRRQFGVVLDLAHCALNGEPIDMAIDIAWSHLCMVNLKNAYWRRINGPEAEVAEYRHFWTSGRQGLCSWPAVATELRRRGYTGTICLTAEYSAQDDVDRLIADDVQFARSLFS